MFHAVPGDGPALFRTPVRPHISSPGPSRIGTMSLRGIVMLSRPNLRRIAFLRRNRCSVLVAALCLFILLNPLIADSLVGVTILASCLMAILLVAMWAIRAHTL